MSPPLQRITLYMRPECHLCDEARDAILELRAEGLAFELHEVDIDRDDALHTAYLERIPVVEVGGRIVSELRLDLDAVRSSLDTVTA
jgi:hypothetical protein